MGADGAKRRQFPIDPKGQTGLSECTASHDLRGGFVGQQQQLSAREGNRSFDKKIVRREMAERFLKGP